MIAVLVNAGVDWIVDAWSVGNPEAIQADVSSVNEVGGMLEGLISLAVANTRSTTAAVDVLHGSTAVGSTAVL